MEFALDIASFVFVITLLFGGVLLGALLINLLRDRYSLRFPTTTPLPTVALDSARQTLEHVRALYFQAGGDRRNMLGHEVQRLEMRIQFLQARTADDQYPYYQLCRQREKTWAEWKNLFDRLPSVHGAERRRLRNGVARAIRRFQHVERLVDAEWRRAIARDDLRLEELRTQGVLELEAQEGPLEFPEEMDGESLAAEAEAAESAGAEPTAEGSGDLPPGTGGDGGAAETGPADVPDSSAEPATEPAVDPATEMDTERLDAAIDAAMAEADRDPAAPGENGAEPAPEEGTVPTAAQPESSPLELVTTGLDPWGDTPSGELNQERLNDPDAPKSGLRYRDPTLSVAGLPGGRLSGTDLSRSVFGGVHFVGVHRYVRCNFAGADLRRIRLSKASAPHQFVECNFHGAAFHESTLEYALFLRCDLTDSGWRGAQLNGAKFADSRLDGADWEAVDLSRSVFSGRSRDTADWSAAARPPHDTGAPDQPAPGPPADAAAAQQPAPPTPEVATPAQAPPATAAATPPPTQQATPIPKPAPKPDDDPT